MRGFPMSFATKQDYVNCLQIYPEQTKAELKRLYADRFTWKKGKKLEGKDKGVEDSKHLILREEITDEKTGEKSEVYYQAELIEDSNARYLQLGFTAEEIKKLLD